MPIVRARVVNQRSVSSLSHFSHSHSLSLFENNDNTVYELAKTLPQYGIGRKFTKTNWERKGTTKARRVKNFSNVLDAHENTAESERENWTRRVWDFDLKGRRRATEEKIGGTHKTGGKCRR